MMKTMLGLRDFSWARALVGPSASRPRTRIEKNTDTRRGFSGMGCHPLRRHDWTVWRLAESRVLDKELIALHFDNGRGNVAAAAASTFNFVADGELQRLDQLRRDHDVLRGIQEFDKNGIVLGT